MDIGPHIDTFSMVNSKRLLVLVGDLVQDTKRRDIADLQGKSSMRVRKN